MATVPYTMQPAVVTASVATYVTCPANQYLTTKRVTVTNTSASPVALTLYKVPSGGSALTGNQYFAGVVIPANTSNGGAKLLFECENINLYAGDTLQASAGTAGVLNLNVSGILQTT